MKERKRWIAIQFISGRASRREFQEFLKTIKESPKLVFFDFQKQVGVIKCKHLQVDLIRSIFQRTIEISGKEMKAKIIGVSGTLKALKRKFLELKSV